jgi:hypothetical protein
MRTLYDLSRYLPSFNFFEWLVQAKALGATRVVFDVRNVRAKKWSHATCMRRFHSICVPGCALAELPYEVIGPTSLGAVVAREIAHPGGEYIVAFWRKHGRIVRLKSPKPAAEERYTVTLRKTERSPLRDSNDKAWREFAGEIGARVIEDYDVKPIHLHDRMALYAGAEMNFFVSNGPGVLCSFTEYPCMLMNTHHAYGSLKADGLQWGDQYPWMLADRQRAIWEQDTADNLRKHFYEWRDHGRWLEQPPAPDTLGG